MNLIKDFYSYYNYCDVLLLVFYVKFYSNISHSYMDMFTRELTVNIKYKIWPTVLRMNFQYSDRSLIFNDYFDYSDYRIIVSCCTWKQYHLSLARIRTFCIAGAVQSLVLLRRRFINCHFCYIAVPLHFCI